VRVVHRGAISRISIHILPHRVDITTVIHSVRLGMWQGGGSSGTPPTGQLASKSTASHQSGISAHNSTPPKPRKQLASKVAIKTSIPTISGTRQQAIAPSLQIHQAQVPTRHLDGSHASHPSRAAKQVSPARLRSLPSGQKQSAHPYVSRRDTGPFSLTRADAQLFISPRMAAPGSHLFFYVLLKLKLDLVQSANMQMHDHASPSLITGSDHLLRSQ
jgi:hypothetical protein